MNGCDQIYGGCDCNKNLTSGGHNLSDCTVYRVEFGLMNIIDTQIIKDSRWNGLELFDFISQIGDDIRENKGCSKYTGGPREYFEQHWIINERML